jgi:polyhydroxyalkanoate synthesis repressor PhaR
MRIIKRYKNRRLYDTHEKKTIKLEHLVELVKNDVEFKVIDNATEKDITFSTLGHVLSQEMKEWKNSAKIVKELILTGGEVTVDVFKKALLAGLGLFDLTKEKAEKIVDDLVQRGELSKGEEAKAVKELLKGHDERMKKLKQKIDERVEKVTKKIKGVEKKDFEELSRRINDLAKAVEKLEQKLGK